MEEKEGEIRETETAREREHTKQGCSSSGKVVLRNGSSGHLTTRQRFPSRSWRGSEGVTRKSEHVSQVLRVVVGNLPPPPLLAATWGSGLQLLGKDPFPAASQTSVNSGLTPCLIGMAWPLLRAHLDSRATYSWFPSLYSVKARETGEAGGGQKRWSTLGSTLFYSELKT